MSTKTILPLIGLLALPLAAQTKNALLPAPTSVAANAENVSPVQDNSNVLHPPQETWKSGRTLYGWSIAAVLGANAADAATSWRAQEANRVVAGTAASLGPRRWRSSRDS